MKHYITSVCELHGLHCTNSRVVSGGDINSSYAIDTHEGCFFLKVNSAAAYTLMFAKEAEGLEAIRTSCKLKVPKVIATGVYLDKQYLLLEWLYKAPSSNNFWQVFAEGLAQLHTTLHPHFGWSSSNYIGSLVQANEPAETWAEFYAAQRILPLVKQLYNEGIFSESDIHNTDKVCNHLHNIFPGEPPALLHGDLWAGNFMAVRYGDKDDAVVPAIFDPAVYYGHREMDIGMSLLFGGFDEQFYDAYNDVHPLENNWRKRTSLTQLYPLLVHAILFGRAYAMKCRHILQQWC